jgi:hypothetical protein
VRLGARELVVSHSGSVVAHHLRLQGRYQTAACLDHYLECLQHKPGALKGSLPLAQQRAEGRWPQAFDQLWRALEQRYGASEAARQMVDVCLLCREHGPAQVELAVRAALAAGAYDGAAVALLARQPERTHRQAPQQQVQLFELPERAAGAHTRAEPTLGDYDQLLRRGARQ